MIITVHAKPGARETKVGPWLDDSTVKVSVTARAEGGKANDAVIKALAEHLNLAPSTLRLVRGATTRMKQVEVPSKNPA